MVLESDQIKEAQFDTTGFVDVFVLHNATDATIRGTTKWIREQHFDAIFYPQVSSTAAFSARAVERAWL